MSTDFSSIDRLIEFGMGMGLAQQMINTMNQSMNTMRIAGVNAGTTGQLQGAVRSADSRQWFAAVDNRQVGPLSDDELLQLISRGIVVDKSLLWTPGLPAWKMARDIPEVNKMIILNPQQI